MRTGDTFRKRVGISTHYLGPPPEGIISHTIVCCNLGHCDSRQENAYTNCFGCHLKVFGCGIWTMCNQTLVVDNQNGFLKHFLTMSRNGQDVTNGCKYSSSTSLHELICNNKCSMVFLWVVNWRFQNHLRILMINSVDHNIHQMFD